MERLKQKNINSPEMYDLIYLKRLAEGTNGQDMRRWKRMMKKYKGGSVLDIGCLDSSIPSMVKPENYTGIDYSPAAISGMRNNYPLSHFICDDFLTYTFSLPYDYILMGEFLEHQNNPKQMVDKGIALLRKGGRLVISVPLEEAREKGAVDEDRHVWSFSIKDIKEMLRPYGEVHETIMGSEYFPKYVYHWPIIIMYLKKK